MEAHQLLVQRTRSDASPARGHHRAEAVVRRSRDILVATLLLLLFLPVIVLIAIAVRIGSPGPVLFRQRRVGRDLREFTMLKFRTMRHGADSTPHRDYTRRLITGDGGGPHQGLFKLAVDNRITPVGRFLRAWSLDELPQLINVLRGDMSLVGPRPVIDYEVDYYADWYLARFGVKPGLTGLWQVSGRNERTYEEMVRFDVEYAEHQSFGLDVKILFKTVWVVLRRKGVA